MKRVILAYIGLLAVVLLAVFLKNGTINLNLGSNPSASIGNKKINLILAKTIKDQQIGLTSKDKLNNNEGMLFVFSTKDYPGFWMRNMKFPIDIIFIEDNKIVDIFQNVQPAEKNSTNVAIYKPKNKANFVLEVNANTSKQLDLKVGDKISLNNIK